MHAGWCWSSEGRQCYSSAFYILVREAHRNFPSLSSIRFLSSSQKHQKHHYTSNLLVNILANLLIHLVIINFREIILFQMNSIQSNGYSSTSTMTSTPSKTFSLSTTDSSPIDLTTYSRRMSLHTKRQMEAASRAVRRRSANDESTNVNASLEKASSISSVDSREL